MSTRTSDERAALAQSWFDKGCNCAQSVLLAFHEDLGLDKDAALRQASVFGAGMGRLQETCGALTGAFMALGMARGFSDPADMATRDRLVAETRELAASFRDEFASLRCRDLLGCDLATPEGQAFHKDQGQRAGICSPCVRHAAARLNGILLRG